MTIVLKNILKSMLFSSGSMGNMAVYLDVLSLSQQDEEHDILKAIWERFASIFHQLGC